MTNRQNILLLSAGRRVKLLQAFKSEVFARDLNSLVMATDLNPKMSAACQIADNAFAMPCVDTEGYIDELLLLCEREEVGLIIPTIDTELLLLAKARQQFGNYGTSIVVSDEFLIKQCRDKRLTAQLFTALGIHTPREIDRNQITFPCFVKPFDGSRSIGAVKLNQVSDLTESILNDPKLLFMEYIDRSFDEYTVDAYFDRFGNLKSLVPRLRLEVRDGEISKGATQKNYVYNYLVNKLRTLNGARGCLTIQLFARSEDQRYVALEINPRFGGGYPLSYAAGANYPGWLIDEYLLNIEVPFFDSWESGLLMLRYDEQVLVHHAY